MVRSEPPGLPPAQASDVILIGGAKTKQTFAAPASELYISPLFRCAREYAEQSGAPWFILSAEHGVLGGEVIVEPYDCAQGDLPARARQHWALLVASQLEGLLGSLTGKSIEVHIGSKYATPLRRLLSERGATVTEPLAGLPLGRRLSWYGQRSSCH